MVVSTIAYPSTLVLSTYILCDSFNTQNHRCHRNCGTPHLEYLPKICLPDKGISDKGPQFASKVFKEMGHLLGIELTNKGTTFRYIIHGEICMIMMRELRHCRKSYRHFLDEISLENREFSETVRQYNGICGYSLWRMLQAIGN